MHLSLGKHVRPRIQAFGDAAALFVPDGRGRYRRFDERHIQRAHRTEELAALLERSGFSLLSITEALTDAAPAETSERIQFAARRNEE